MVYFLNSLVNYSEYQLPYNMVYYGKRCPLQQLYTDFIVNTLINTLNIYTQIKHR